MPLTRRFSNGSYTQYCDLSRQYDPVPSPNTTTGLPNGAVVPAYNGSGIGTFLEPFGRYDLLEYMNTYWIAQNSPNQDLWGVSGPHTFLNPQRHDSKIMILTLINSTSSQSTPHASLPLTSPATALITPSTKK